MNANSHMKYCLESVEGLVKVTCGNREGAVKLTQIVHDLGVRDAILGGVKISRIVGKPGYKVTTLYPYNRLFGEVIFEVCDNEIGKRRGSWNRQNMRLILDWYDRGDIGSLYFPPARNEKNFLGYTNGELCVMVDNLLDEIIARGIDYATFKTRNGLVLDVQFHDTAQGSFWRIGDYTRLNNNNQNTHPLRTLFEAYCRILSISRA